MATQTSLLPVYHEPGDPSKTSSELNMDMDLSGWMTQQPSLQDEAFLQELLSGQGDDLLSSLLEPTPGSTNPSSTSIGAPLTFDFDATLGGVQTNLLPTSPAGSDGCTSDSYSITNGGSPLTNVNGGAPVVAEHLGASPQQQLTESPNHSPSPFMSSALPVTTAPSQIAMDPSLDFSDFNGIDLTNFMTSDATISSTSLSPPQAPPTTATNTITNSVQPSASNDIRIDVEPHSSDMRGSVSSDISAASPQSSSHSPSPPSTSSSSDRKASTLYLTDEEKRLLAAEGIALPTDMPLTKAEQKQLKRVQRKIKNKISAQESRKRKKDYVEGLEERVKICTDRNQELKREVDCLKSENQSLLAQLKKLQAIVFQYNPSKVQAGTVMMVLILSFSLFLVPRMKYFAPSKGVSVAMNGFSRHSRTLLFTATDEFGNVIDPETGRIISPVGGQSPSPPLPWVYQTPAILQKINRTLLNNGGSIASTEGEKGDEKAVPSLDDSRLRKSESSEHIETANEL